MHSNWLSTGANRVIGAIGDMNSPQSIIGDMPFPLPHPNPLPKGEGVNGTTAV